MKKFYAVTAGDYSDYHIVAITDDKEKAERIKYLCNYGNSYGYDSDARIGEYGEVIQDGLVHYSVTLFSDGETSVGLELDTSTEYEINKVTKGIYGHYHVDVRAKDRSHAIKIASDLIAQYKAQENGIV